MKESILGLTTMAILFGLVWLSQGEIYTSKDSFKEDTHTNQEEISSDSADNLTSADRTTDFKDVYEEEEPVDTCEICKNINEVNPNILYEDQYTNMYDNFTFSEAFKLCRQCQGNDGIFYWKNNLYLTEIKKKEIDVVEKELSVSKTPPNITHEAVSSK
jgi:hypothetical protein